jgi:hypothetical protein
MKHVIAAYGVGVVLLVALYACASNLPTAQNIGDLHTAESACVSWADAKPAADECIQITYKAFCAKYPDSCPSDGGAE